jgi:hypothetical protein
MAHILATGFYFRGNLGDAVYPLVLQRMFGSNITCHCTDDLQCIPEGTQAIIVGGGDVVNPFFMEKIAQLTATFHGPMYLLSVGIPYYGSDLRYLRMFDHVFVRSNADFRAARTVLPDCDVTCFRDMAWSLSRSISTDPVVRPVGRGRVAFTCAQPYMHNNQHSEAMKDSLVKVITAMSQRYDEVLLIAFNTRLASRAECDIYLNRDLCQRCACSNVSSVEDVTDPEAMLSLFDSLDLLVGMRLHSIIFAMMQKVPFVCMYTTRKVGNVLKEIGAADWGYQLPVDAQFKPTCIDEHTALDLIGARLELGSRFEWHEPQVPVIDWDVVKQYVTTQKTKACLPTDVSMCLVPFEQAAARCKHLVTSYCSMADSVYDAWIKGAITTQAAVDEQAYSLLEVCRLVCYALTDSTASPCLWGLHENCQKPGFRLGEAVRYIYGDQVNKALAALTTMASEPSQQQQQQQQQVSYNKAKHFVQVTRQDLYEFAGTHRAGWPFVVKGLMQFDAGSNFKEPEMLVDTYVDRTFHWGHDALLLEGTIPYTRPWIGFVHHTFTTDHGPYNCDTLFKKQTFLASLVHCRCLIALSAYLAEGLRNALDKAGFYGVGVEMLFHPTEPVPEHLCFSIDNLLANPTPKLVQIGSWLRSSYALYKMPFMHHTDICLKRCILKARESTNYLRPRAVEDALQLMLEQSQTLRDKNMPKCCNFYVQELVQHIREQEQSVTLLERLSNAEYDVLMAENVCFVRLVDCSACNTIIETMARSGVILCNRHPAAEEYLGADYPGFYDTLDEAAYMASSLGTIAACHKYMKALDKTKIELETFLTGFEAVLERYC